jgi:hypothetical protein
MLLPELGRRKRLDAGTRVNVVSDPVVGICHIIDDRESQGDCRAS